MKTIVLFVIFLLAGTTVFAQEGFEDVQYDDTGKFAVQVEAWRSEVKAENRVSSWKEQGFSHSIFAREGDEATGDVWFRVFLGRFSNIEHAEHFQAVFSGMFDDETWITTTKDISEPITDL